MNGNTDQLLDRYQAQVDRDAEDDDAAEAAWEVEYKRVKGLIKDGNPDVVAELLFDFDNFHADGRVFTVIAQAMQSALRNGDESGFAKGLAEDLACWMASEEVPEA